MAHVCCSTLCYRTASYGVDNVSVGTASIRVLVAIEEDYRVYQDVIATGIRILRPHITVASTGLDVLEDEIRRLDPHVVISSLPYSARFGDRLAWVELALDLPHSSVVHVGGRRLELQDPQLDALLETIDEAERLVGE